MTYEDVLHEYLKTNPPQYSKEEIYTALKCMIERMIEIQNRKCNHDNLES